MHIQPEFSLASLTTFRIGGPAKYYAKISSRDELFEVLAFAKKEGLSMLVLGGGSNALVSDKGFDGLVIEIDLKGVDITDLPDGAEVKLGAGENWDDVVATVVFNGFWGIENLSGIPGKVGAFPVQNVGAYGQEASQVVKEVEVWDLLEEKILVIPNIECGFEYRKSNFNSEWKDKFVILSVTLKLKKDPSPNLSYGDVEKYFTANNNLTPSINEIRSAIIQIRQSKFPNLNEFGCAGSFFKNIILTPEQYLVLEGLLEKNFTPEVVKRLREIKDRFKQIKSIKIPAAFLIDICGLKGKTLGGAKLWEKQPLVIVNTGKATSADVAGLFKIVQKEVHGKTGITLLPEPEFIGFSEHELANYLNLN